MEIKIKREMDCMDQVDLFGKKPELTLTPKLTGLFTTVGVNLTSLRNWGEEQISGLQSLNSGVEQRRGLAKEIRGTLRDIAELAKSMEEEGQVGMKELFRYPKYSTYENLILTGETFADHAEGMEAEFTERGLAVTFVADLRAQVTAFRAATAVKLEGKSDRSAGTAGLAITAAAGMKAVRTLRPLMRVHLKEQPALLAAWNAAARVERPPTTAPVAVPLVAPTEPETPPSGS